MSIVSLEYSNDDALWALERMTFDRLNLLVGPSGAGKTRIVEALLSLRRAALQGAPGVPSSQWRLELDCAGRRVVWRARTRVSFFDPLRVWSNEDRHEGTDASFLSEELEIDGERVVQRNEEEFEFHSKALPRLDRSESALKLLGDEPEIVPVRRVLAAWRQIEGRIVSIRGPLASVDAADRARQEHSGSLEMLRHAKTSLGVKLYILQQDHPDEFDELKEDLRSVFPEIQDLWIATLADLGVRPRMDESRMVSELALGVRERGVQGWIPHWGLSAGLEKSITILAEVKLAAAGATLFIDELENGMGENCLPDVAIHLQQRLAELQYVITSHHPRIIRAIAMPNWRIVEKQNSRIKVRSADDFPLLAERSSIDSFTRLLNTEPFDRGAA